MGISRPDYEQQGRLIDLLDVVNNFIKYEYRKKWSIVNTCNDVYIQSDNTSYHWTYIMFSLIVPIISKLEDDISLTFNPSSSNNYFDDIDPIDLSRLIYGQQHIIDVMFYRAQNILDERHLYFQ